MHHPTTDHHAPPSFWSTRYAPGLVILGGVAAYFVLTEHFAHFVQALPYVLLLACPLMHLFMHGGHGHHDGAPPARPDDGATDDAGERP